MFLLLVVTLPQVSGRVAEENAAIVALCAAVAFHRAVLFMSHHEVNH